MGFSVLVTFPDGNRDGYPRYVQSRYDLSRDDLAALLENEPSYRVEQVWHGLYSNVFDPSEMTVLSRKLRERLAAAPEMRPALRPVVESRTDNGDTIKWLFELHDG